MPKKYKPKKEKILKSEVDIKGYLRVNLSKNSTIKHIKIHRLVAEAFISNPLNLNQVNHKDENKENNCVNNLEWCDSRYNNNYGTRKKRAGEKVSKSLINNPKITKKVFQYDLQGKFIKEWISATEVQRQLGIKRPLIVRVCKGRRKSTGGFIWKYDE